jgi:spore maturation protein SpmA
MILNYIWFAFFAIAFLLALVKLVFFGDFTVFPALVNSTFEMAKKGFEISIGMAGATTLWLGLMKIGEKGGLIMAIAKRVNPFFRQLFPEIPENHPAMASIMMNFSANMLGLDNAATPLGINAMMDLQSLNKARERASNAMIMFLVINTAGLTIIPVSVMALRATAGAKNPADIFIPCLIGTSISAFGGILILAFKQRLNFKAPALWGTLLVYVLGLSGLVWYFAGLTDAQVEKVSTVSSAIILFSLVLIFLSVAFFKKVNVYEAFIEGAKTGFETAVRVIPYIIGMLVGIGVFRESGALNLITQGISNLVLMAGLDTAFIPALPTGLMKPFSGSGARGLMIETMQTHGPDSFVGKMVCILQGSTETTFYTLALYYGAVNVRNTRYTATVGLIVDAIGIVAAICLGYLFF